MLPGGPSLDGEFCRAKVRCVPPDGVKNGAVVQHMDASAVPLRTTGSLLSPLAALPQMVEA